MTVHLHIQTAAAGLVHEREVDEAAIALSSDRFRNCRVGTKPACLSGLLGEVGWPRMDVGSAIERKRPVARNDGNKIVSPIWGVVVGGGGSRWHAVAGNRSCTVGSSGAPAAAADLELEIQARRVHMGDCGI